VALKQRQSVVPVVGVEHCEAEFNEHVDSGGAGAVARDIGLSSTTSTDAFAINNSGASRTQRPSGPRCP
jgi:hypothetical protein